MRKNLTPVPAVIVLVAISFGLSHLYTVTLKAQAPITSSAITVKPYFSPRGGCQEAVVREIGQANKSVLIQAYSFTNVSIAKALLDAKKRGVTCEAILDKSNRTDKYSAATFLSNQGIPVLIDDRHAIAHNKIIIIDETTVITGSFNFTRAAEESNAENLVVMKGLPDVAKEYLDNYRTHRQHTMPYERSVTKDGTGSGAGASRSPAVDNDSVVYVTRNGSKYHTKDCRFAGSKAIPMKFRDARGKYGPCSQCNPPH